MEEGTFQVRFVPAPGKLAPNEKACAWEPDCTGKVRFDPDAIRLEGKRKMGVVGNVLTMGVAQPLLKHALAKNQAEVIPIQTLDRVEASRGRFKDTVVLRVFQRLDGGIVAVHSFVVGLFDRNDVAGLALDALRVVVPATLLKGDAVASAVGAPAVAAPAPDWYPDPSGSHQYRYWDGGSWSPQVADEGLQSVDPLTVDVRAAPEG